MPKSILVLDDAHGNLAELTDVLTRSGYAPAVHGEGADALAAFTAAKAELCFISLDGHDGGAACDAIRADPDGAIVPIVLVGKAHPEVRSAGDALALGADFYFERPLDLAKVLAKTQTYVGKGDTPIDPATLTSRPREEAPAAAAPTLAGPADELLSRLREEEQQAAAEQKRQQEEAQALAEAEERARKDNEERIRKDAELETRRRIEAETRRRVEEEAQKKAEEEQKKLGLFEAQRKAEQELREQAARRAEAEAREQAARDQAAREAQLRAELEHKVRAEAEARLAAELEQKRRADAEAHKQAAMEAEIKKQVEDEIRRRMGLPPSEPAAAGGVLARAAAAASGLVQRALGRDDALNQGEPARPVPAGMTPLDPAEALFGETRDIAEIMAIAHRQEVTGRVDFISEQRQKSVFFERGVPVDAYSSQVFDRMEEYLLRNGKITRAQYQEVRVKGLKGPRKVGAYLVSSGYLKPHELFEAVRGHLAEVFCGVFEFESGTYRYLPERASEDDRIALDLDVRALILEGVRRKYLVPRLMKRVGGPSTLLGMKAGAVPDFELLRLAEAERAVVRLVDGTRNIEDIVFSSGLEALRVYHVLVGLVLLGYAEVLVRGLEGNAKDGVLTADGIDKNRILDKIEQIRQLDYFQILGVAKSATPYEIDRAYERNLAEFEPNRFSSSLREQMFEELGEITRVLADAREVLRDEQVRDAYARHLP